MKLNIGLSDRIIRLLLASTIAILYFTDQISGFVTIVLGLLALIFVLTSFVGVCPLYLPFKFSTRKVEKSA